MTRGPKCREGPASKSLPKYQSPWCLNNTDKNECPCVSPKELAIIFFIQCKGIVLLLFCPGLQGLYEGMQEKIGTFFSFSLL